MSVSNSSSFSSNSANQSPKVNSGNKEIKVEYKKIGDEGFIMIGGKAHNVTDVSGKFIAADKLCRLPKKQRDSIVAYWQGMVKANSESFKPGFKSVKVKATSDQVEIETTRKDNTVSKAVLTNKQVVAKVNGFTKLYFAAMQGNFKAINRSSPNLQSPSRPQSSSPSRPLLHNRVGINPPFSNVPNIDNQRSYIPQNSPLDRERERERERALHHHHISSYQPSNYTPSYAPIHTPHYHAPHHHHHF